MGSLVYYLLFLAFPFPTQTDEEDRALAIDSEGDTEMQGSSEIIIGGSSEKLPMKIG